MRRFMRYNEESRSALRKRGSIGIAVRKETTMLRALLNVSDVPLAP